MYKKIVIFVIIGFFIGTSFLPNTICEEESRNDVDWWSMFRHDITYSNRYRNDIKIFYNDPPPSWLKGADQTQISYQDWITVVNLTNHCAQEFKPTKRTLTAVAFCMNKPPSGIKITISIRRELHGVDLTTTTVNTDTWKLKVGWKNWTLFDFEDIEVTPDETYFIICAADKDDKEIGLRFDIGNKYDRGIAYSSNNSGDTWHNLENPFNDPDFVEIDFTFITYYQKPKSKIKINPFLIFLENHPYMFPILQKILKI
jgi:hypothetical protein